jgi:membrane-associated phospholipid phosphatase
VLTAALTLGCLLTGRRRGAVLAILAVPVTAVITDGLLKPLVHRTYIGQVVYPSGHTATIAALAATATVLLLAPPRPEMARPLRVLILAVAYLACEAVVVGVIAVRFHYFTDTVAGAAVGIGTVCGLDLGISHFRRPAVIRPAARPAAAPAGPAGNPPRPGRRNPPAPTDALQSARPPARTASRPPARPGSAAAGAALPRRLG